MNEKLGIAICDDDTYYLEQIYTYISEMLAKKNISFFINIFHSGEEFMKELSDLQKYSMIFLDIEMQGINGMEIAKKIRSCHYEMSIVFVTVMINYVYDGYKVNAFRYIIKETLREGIYECVDAFLKMRDREERSVYIGCVGGQRNIKLNDIIYLESLKHRVTIYLKSEELMVYEKLDKLEQLISSEEYVRIHKSFLVNMSYINKIYDCKVYLGTDRILPVARTRYGDVKEKYLRYRDNN